MHAPSAPSSTPSAQPLAALYARSIDALHEAGDLLGALDVFQTRDVDQAMLQRVARNMRAVRAVVTRILQEHGTLLDPRTGPLHLEHHTRTLARVLQRMMVASIAGVVGDKLLQNNPTRVDEYRLYGMLHAAMHALRFAVWYEHAMLHEPPKTTAMDMREFREAVQDVRDDTARSLGGLIQLHGDPPARTPAAPPLAVQSAAVAAPRAPNRYVLNTQPGTPPSIARVSSS